MDCSCGIDIDPDCNPSFYKERLHKAKKQHKCQECYRVIEIGETYEQVKGVWEGEFQMHKTCSDCLSARKVFFNSNWYFGEVWGMIFEHIDNSYGDVSSDCIIPLTPKARNKVCDYIEAYHAEQDYDDE